MLEPLGHKPSFWKMYHSVMIGYLINLTIPRSGEVARAGYYAKYQRNGKVFHCKRSEHRTANSKVYKCNADLNAARNIALWPPLTIIAINT